MTEITDDWPSFLARWNQEWADAQAIDAPEGERCPGDEEHPPTRRLGFPPASEERILAVEERLGHRLPPSYRTFLAVSDGWRYAGGFVWHLAGTAEVRRHEDAAGLSEFFPGDLGGDPTPQEALLAGMWDRAVQLDVESDMVHVLLDPGDVDAAGEWAVYSYASWRASPPERFPSFRAFMEAMYREFHRLEVNRENRAATEFTNATTRALDASVETARLDALGGRYEHALAVLDDALAFGRPRASGLRDQIRLLLGQAHTVSFHGLTANPVYAPDMLPVVTARHLRHRPADTTLPHLSDAPDAVRAQADEILRQMRDGTFRYTAEGPFGRAVEEAREQARWGDGDAAWQTVRRALSAWQPLGPDHLAPVGLWADPLLAPLLTPEHGRELLATPRAGHPGDTPVPAPGIDPPGLAWLADVDRGSDLASYRFVLVESVEPAGLPGRLCADDTTVLREPRTLWESFTQVDRDRDPTWEDTALAIVGRAGPRWSFAFEPHPSAPFVERRFVSPGTAASRGTRAVTVWSVPSESHRPRHFHLSVAENGVELYAFTVRGSAVSAHGAVPDGLDPDRLFRPGASDDPEDPDSGRQGERRALDAIAAEFGVRLPRAALRRGRLHTLRTRAWNRPPAPGETYATLRMTRTRP